MRLSRGKRRQNVNFQQEAKGKLQFRKYMMCEFFMRVRDNNVSCGVVSGLCYCTDLFIPLSNKKHLMPMFVVVQSRSRSICSLMKGAT